MTIYLIPRPLRDSESIMNSSLGLSCHFFDSRCGKNSKVRHPFWPSNWVVEFALCNIFVLVINYITRTVLGNPTRLRVSDFYWLNPPMFLLAPFAFRDRGISFEQPQPRQASALTVPQIADISLRCAWNTKAPSTRSVVSERTDGELPIAHRPQTRVYGSRKSSRGSRRPERFPWRLGCEALCFSRPTTSFSSVTASQKEVTAFHSLSLRTMANTRADT